MMYGRPAGMYQGTHQPRQQSESAAVSEDMDQRPRTGCTRCTREWLPVASKHAEEERGENSVTVR